MTGKELLTGIAHLDADLIEEAEFGSFTRKKSLIRRKTIRFMLAACLVIAMSTAAFAAVYSYLAERKVEIAGVDAYQQDPMVQATGILGSPEYLAAIEWNQYEDEANAAGTNPFTPDTPSDVYTWMGAYSQEARAALDDIIAKYGLKLPKSQRAISVKDLAELTGSASAIPAEVNGPGTYLEGGSLAIVSAAVLPNGKRLDFDVNRNANGWFSRGIRYFTDPDNMEEWTYSTAEGVNVTLDLGPNNSVLMAKLDGGFVYIHIRSGTQNSDPERSSYGKDTLTKTDLEAFAQTIDFRALDSIQ